MSRKGFTLIELLVVVAVLALLASIVFSNLRGAREGARISNALSFQSQTHSLLGSDLVGWWNFNEGSGSVANDLSGYGNNGTITGATHTDGVPGTGGSALKFNGSGDRIVIAHDEIISLSRAVSIGFWFNMEEYPPAIGGYDWYSFIQKDNYGQTYGLMYSRSGFFRLYLPPLSNTDYNFTPDLGTWYNMFIAWDGLTAKFYLNGIEVRSAERSGTINTNTNNIHIGRTSAEYPFLGLIDDVRIYSRALTTSEIQALYAQTKDGYLSEK